MVDQPTSDLEKRRLSKVFFIIHLALLTYIGSSAAISAELDNLNLTGYTVSFEENFDTIDVSARGEKGSRWIAHTPWSGDFGDAKFTDPAPGFPFTISEGVLRIEARKGVDGKWRSGLLASVDKNHKGFSQTNGYFEARMKLPPGPGVWPAFWVMGTDRSKAIAEIDILEYYGHAPDRFSSKRHIWRKKFGGEDDSLYHSTAVPRGSLSSQFHTYGVAITNETLTYYFERKKIWELATPAEYKGMPFYPLVNLALGSGWRIVDTPNPSYLYVDYIRVYKKADQQ